MDTLNELQLSLQRMSMVQIGSTIWRTPAVLQQMKNFFMHDHAADFEMLPLNYVSDLHQKKDWTAIMCYIKSLDFTMIPVSLQTHLMYIVEQMSIRIFEWLQEMAVKLLKYSKYERYAQNIEYFIDNIEWTSIGTIDPGKIYKKRYADCTIERDYFLWYEACNYCFEDCAKDLWGKMSEEAKRKTILKIDTRIDDDFYLVTYWQCKIDDVKHLKDKLFTKNRRTVSRLCSLRDTVPVIMYKLSVNQGNENAVRYFWSLLSCEEKIKQVIAGSEIILAKKCTNSYCFGSYPKNYSDIFCFLLLQMTDNQRHQLITNEFNKTYDPFNIWIILMTWPWEELFLSTMERAWECFSIFDCKFFINKFEIPLFRQYEDYKLLESCNYYKEMLCKVCMNSPRHLRPHFTSRYKQLNTQRETQNRSEFSPHMRWSKMRCRLRLKLK